MTTKDRAKTSDVRRAQQMANVIFGQGCSEVTGVREDGTIDIEMLTPSDRWTDEEWAEFEAECGDV